jgi:hypothetical protein
MTQSPFVQAPVLTTPVQPEQPEQPKQVKPETPEIQKSKTQTIQSSSLANKLLNNLKSEVTRLDNTIMNEVSDIQRKGTKLF